MISSKAHLNATRWRSFREVEVFVLEQDMSYRSRREITEVYNAWRYLTPEPLGRASVCSANGS